MWARDGFIINLGALLSGDQELVEGAGKTIETLARSQTETGQIPDYLKFPNPRARFSDRDFAEAASVDASIWYIISVYYHFAITGNEKPLRRHWERVQRALFWLRCQDVNNCGLLEVPEAGDWTDLLSNRYNILYDEVLHYAALRACGLMAKEMGQDRTLYDARADDVKEKINVLFWVDAKNEPIIRRIRPKWIHIHRRAMVEIESSSYYLPYVTFMGFGYRCDVYANTLAMLLRVCDEARSAQILQYLVGVGADKPYPIRVLRPPVQEGQADWRDYYKYNNLNLPNHHQNGGIWPYAGGFWVATLSNLGRKQDAADALNRLAEANKLGTAGPWEFNECLHGESGQPLGSPFQGWSAGMYLYAYHSTEKGEAPILGKL